MSVWHAWGDYRHTLPDRIGNAKLLRIDDPGAKADAQRSGFDLEQRARNGFSSWAASFNCDEDAQQERYFADSPIVRGWRKR